MIIIYDKMNIGDKMKKYLKLIGIPFIIALGIFLFIKFIWLG